MSKIKVAVVGATGAVGREILQELLSGTMQEKIDVTLFASPRSAGNRIDFEGKFLTIQKFSVESMKGFDAVLMSVSGDFSLKYAKDICAQGPLVIDNSSAWRMDKETPLIVPEVNGESIRQDCGIIANPNCSTIQMVVALSPLARFFGLEMVQVSTYQAVSGAGQKGMEELSRQVQEQLNMKEVRAEKFPLPIAFNAIPGVGDIMEDGWCFEEQKMILETRKIMDLPTLPILATTVRVPVFNGHSEVVTVKLKEKVSRKQLDEIFSSSEGIIYSKSSDSYESLPTPRSVNGSSQVHVARVRLPLGEESSQWLQMWVVADNLKKGAATNAVQIFERAFSG